MAGERRVADRLLAAAALLALAAWHFRDVAFRGEVLFRRDVHLMWYTQVTAFVAAIRRHEWPLWNPLIGFGQPLWADANVQVLYPATWLNLVLAPWTAYTLYVVGHVVWGGLGVHLLARRLGLRPAGALAASLLFAASGPLLSLAEVWNQLGGAAWMPWAVLGGVAALSGDGRRWSVLWGLAHAAQVMVGAPECALMAAAGLVAWAAASRPWRGRPFAAVGSAAIALALALGISAGQWAPALEASSRAGRARLSYEARTHWSVPPAALVETLAPVLFDRLPLTDAARRMAFGAAEPLVPSLYLGLPALGLVIAGVLAWPRRARLAFAAAVAASVLAALGAHTPAYAAATAVLPPLALFRYPVKAVVALALAWALAAGRGTDAWLAEARWERVRTAAVALPCALAGIGLLVAALALHGLPAPAARLLVEGARGGAPVEAAVRRLAVGGAAAVAISLLAWRRAGARRRHRLGVAAAAAAVVELAAVHDGLSPAAPAALFTIRPPALSLAAPPGDGRLYAYDYFVPGKARAHLRREYPYRIARAPEGWAVPASTALSMRLALFPPTAGAWGVAGSFDRDTPGLAPAVVTAVDETLLLLEGTPGHLRLLQMGAVSRVAALHDVESAGLVPLGTADALLPEPVRVFAVPGASPRAYAVGGSRPAPARNPVAALLDPRFDPAREVLLQGAAAAVAPPDGFSGTVRIRHIGADRVALEAELGAPGYVVLVDAWDPGWRAAVDGAPTAVLLANAGFRAVAVGAGHHEVTMTYRPRSLVPALGLTLLAAGAAAVLAWAARPTSGTAPRA